MPQGIHFPHGITPNDVREFECRPFRSFGAVRFHAAADSASERLALLGARLDNNPVASLMSKLYAFPRLPAATAASLFSLLSSLAREVSPMEYEEDWPPGKLHHQAILKALLISLLSAPEETCQGKRMGSVQLGH